LVQGEFLQVRLMLVAIYQFCLWVVVVTIGALLCCAIKTLREYRGLGLTGDRGTTLDIKIPHRHTCIVGEYFCG